MTKSIRHFPYIFFSEGKDVSRMTLSVIGTIPPGGLGGAGAPPMCRPPFLPGSEKKKSEVKSKSSFKSAENRAASSPWVGGHR